MRAAASQAFRPAFAEVTPFGTLVAVHLPQGVDAVPAAVLRTLHPEEEAVARSLAGRRQIEFTGGRLALRLAAHKLGLELGAVLRGPRGEPLLPPSLSGTIAHKRGMAAALLAPAAAGTLGLDLEEPSPERMSIASRILRPEEERRILTLPAERRWEEVILRFAVKEAVYKALHPHVNRYVRFSEAYVDLVAKQPPSVILHLDQGEGPFQVEARADRREGLIVALTRVSHSK